MNLNNLRHLNWLNIIVKAAVVMFVVFLLFIAGAMTALAPWLIARLLPIGILVIVILTALMSANDKRLSEKTLNIWLAVLLSTMALWPTYLLIKFSGLPALDARRVVAGLTLGATLYFLLSRKYFVKALFTGGYFRVGSFLVLSYATLRIASCFTSEHTFASLIIVFWEILYYYSMFFVGALLFGEAKYHQWLMKILMVLAVLIAGYAAVEWLFEKNILIQLAPSNKEFTEFKAALALSRLREGFFRAQGTFEHPLLLAEFSAMTLCFGLAAMLWSKKEDEFRVLGGITIVAAIGAALLSGSRSALITTTLGGLIVILLRIIAPKVALKKRQQTFRKIAFFFTLSAVIAVAIPAASVLVKGRTTNEAASTVGRIYMLELGIPSILSNPLLGKGPGSSGAIAGIRTGSGIGTLDNYLLAIAIESGVPALFLFLACLLYPVWVIFNKLMTGEQTLANFYAAVAAALVVTTIMRTVLWMPYNLLFSFLLAGMVLRSISNNPKNTDQ